MKVLYIESKSKTKPEDFFIDSSFVNSLPSEVFLTYTIQNKEQAEVLKKTLEAKGIKLAGFSQVLGCTKLLVKENIPIILIAQGRFHALNLALQNKRPILLYSNGSSAVIGEREVKEHNEQVKNALNRFLNASLIGIIISTKPGQEQLKRSENLKEKIEKKYPEKKVYLFISNNINLREFENFNIGAWINSACAGLGNDSSKILNIDDIYEFLG